MSVLGTVSAAVTGFFTGWNPAAMAQAYAIGSGVESIVNPPEQIGPRLEDLKVQMASYGASIPFEWGVNRHAGTVIWPRNLVLREVERTEGGKGGPEVTTYTYYADFAVLIGEGPISAVRRIWANKKLVYDVSAENTGKTTDPAIGALRIYLGTETQEADPIIEAMDGESPAYLGYAYAVFEGFDLTEYANRPPQIEFEVVTNGNTDIPPATVYGEHNNGSATFRADMDGDGYLWIRTMDGHAVYEAGQWSIDENAIGAPQIQQYDPRTKTLIWAYDVQPMAEISAGTVQYTYGIEGQLVASGGWVFTGRGTPGTATGMTDPSAYVHGLAINTQTRAVYTLIDSCSHTQFQNAFYWPSVPVPVIDNNKVYFAPGNGLMYNFALAFMPGSSPDIDPIPTYGVDSDSWNAPYGWAQARAKNAPCDLDDFDGVAIGFPDWAFKSTVIRNPNAVIVQGYNMGGGSYLSWVSASPPVTGFDLSPANVQTTTLPGSHVVMPCIAWDEANQTLWAFTGPSAGEYSNLYAITRGAGFISAEDTGFSFSFPAIPGVTQRNDVKGMTIDESTGYLRVLVGGGFDQPVQMVLLDPINQTIVETMDVGLHIASTTGRMWDVPNQRKVVFANGYYLYDIPYGAAVDAEPVPLSIVVSDICVRAGLAQSDLDVAQLTDLVDGYIVPRQMTARAAIEPLQVAYFFDAVESDEKLKFVKRGGAVAATIPAADRAAGEPGAALPDALSVLRPQELELPVQCDIEYPDLDADHLIGNQYERRITKDTKHTINLRSPVVMTAAKAKQVAAVTLYRAWLTQTFKFTTTRKYSYLEPTDIVVLPTASANFAARLTQKIEHPNGVIEWGAIMEAVSMYSMPVVPAIPNDYIRQAIYDPGETVFHLLDIPMLRDDDNTAGFYVAMDGTADEWRGAELYKSADGGLSYGSVLITNDAAVIGAAQTALPDFEGNIFDEGSTLLVTVSPGSILESVTETQVLNGANVAVIGAPGRWEVVQFKNAELVGERLYRLSGFLRGRRGTEWATGTHQAGDAFVFASLTAWKRVVAASEVGLLRKYKAPPFRIRLSDVSATDFVNTAIALKPFAPVDLTGVRDGSNNLTISWHRRTRLAAGPLHLPAALGETSEAYAVDVVVGGAVARTISSSTQSAVYSAADQTADGITPGAAVTVRVYQISATVGRGYPLEGML